MNSAVQPEKLSASSRESGREVEVLKRLAKGMVYKQNAGELGLYRIEFVAMMDGEARRPRGIV